MQEMYSKLALPRPISSAASTFHRVAQHNVGILRSPGEAGPARNHGDQKRLGVFSRGLEPLQPPLRRPQLRDRLDAATAVCMKLAAKLLIMVGPLGTKRPIPAL